MFTPRTFEEIVTDMINYVKDNTDLTDYEIGSAIRSILEAAALEDDEQYFQMVKLMDAFDINNATGAELDKRLADYGLLRLQPASSSGRVVIEDDSLIRSTLKFDTDSGAVTLQLEDTSDFSTSYTYTVRIGEGTLGVEDVTVSDNNLITNTLTISAALNSHSAGERVSFVSGDSDISIASGQQIQVPATSTAAPIKFSTVEIGVIVNGNFESSPIKAKATVAGFSSNVGVGQISEFSSSQPFSGALVTNKVAFNGGRDLETDPEFRSRARAQIQALSRGTVLALKEASLGVTDPVTGQRVTTANVVEDFVNDRVLVYIDDGTGFSPDQVRLAKSEVATNTSSGSGTIQINDASDFPGEGQIIISPNSSDIETIRYTSVDYSTNTLTLDGSTVNDHDEDDELSLVDPLTLDAEPGATFFKTAKYPLAIASVRIWIDNGSGLELKTEDTDYKINLGTGQLELVDGLAENGVLIAHYTYYTGLIFDVQKVLNGYTLDSTNFPGIKAAGSIVLVTTPVVRRVSVQLSISAQPGFNEEDLKPLVQETVESYISSLGIGEDIILASIIQRAMNINGVFDVIPISPSSDVTILENEISVPFDANGNSLVSVL